MDAKSSPSGVARRKCPQNDTSRTIVTQLPIQRRSLIRIRYGETRVLLRNPPVLAADTSLRSGQPSAPAVLLVELVRFAPMERRLWFLLLAGLWTILQASLLRRQGASGHWPNASPRCHLPCPSRKLTDANSDSSRPAILSNIGGHSMSCDSAPNVSIFSLGGILS